MATQIAPWLEGINPSLYLNAAEAGARLGLTKEQIAQQEQKRRDDLQLQQNALLQQQQNAMGQSQQSQAAQELKAATLRQRGILGEDKIQQNGEIASAADQLRQQGQKNQLTIAGNRDDLTAQRNADLQQYQTGENQNRADALDLRGKTQDSKTLTDADKLLFQNALTSRRELGLKLAGTTDDDVKKAIKSQMDESDSIIQKYTSGDLKPNQAAPSAPQSSPADDLKRKYQSAIQSGDLTGAIKATGDLRTLMSSQPQEQSPRVVATVIDKATGKEFDYPDDFNKIDQSKYQITGYKSVADGGSTGQPKNSQTPSVVKVKSPDGRIGTIPKENLELAIKNGYSEIKQ